MGCGPFVAASGCSRADPVALHQEISRNLPARIDLLNHIEGQRPTPRQDFRSTRARAKNLGELRLGMAKLVDRVVQHVDRVARMERSAIRGCCPAFRLRSMRATN